MKSMKLAGCTYQIKEVTLIAIGCQTFDPMELFRFLSHTLGYKLHGIKGWDKLYMYSEDDITLSYIGEYGRDGYRWSNGIPMWIPETVPACYEIEGDEFSIADAEKMFKYLAKMLDVEIEG